MAMAARAAYLAATRAALAALERNALPDAVTRRLTRLLLAQRLRLGYLPSSSSSAPLHLHHLLLFAHALEEMPIAIETEKAKDQHYELPTTFFKLVLGRNLKYRENELSNVEIIVADISKFEMERSFDRIISIEMFEHMKNYKALLKKLSRWMKEDSLLFVHYFCHKTFAYHFEDNNEDDWITRYFFTGGTMPSANLLLYFQDDVSIANHWLVSGTHYARTSEEWLKRMDKNITSIRPIFEKTYGKESATKWIAYWRTFFISVAELFGYNNGDEWMVAHFLFRKK
ncbi:(S)-coclaurine N-methyltransferase isoform X2 [Oryza sativa Japonica Group]|uniref:(S)-coclaurine N-methyltransferase isoform X2 n=1 Tax=Oryza sativa subsp. japonica TaxID=39947 RepID=UPI000E1B54AA|nr:(S)-coclaurine N-methyltransferase isoform X2 [Oryza sativa Japonica Group]XP_052158971.1 (S)-coclaurine N-methyltransferase-like isoform X2 [Oryza glaberrima]